MDEAAQQAIGIGLNVTIFVVALTISLNLLFSVRDLATVAKDVNDSVADGSKTEAVEQSDNRIITGYEVVSYFYNYTKPYFDGIYNHVDYEVSIDKDGNGSYETIRGNADSLKEFAGSIDIDGKYTLSISEHRDSDDSTKVKIAKVL